MIKKVALASCSSFGAVWGFPCRYIMIYLPEHLCDIIVKIYKATVT